MQLPNSSSRTARGFSLVELMVSLVAGMIVAGAVLAFTVSTVQSSAEYVTATRLTHDLRSTIDYISRELRRAGYDQDYMAQLAQVVGSGTQSAFSPIFLSVDGDCVIYSYDRLPGDPGVVDPENGEIRGIRRVVEGGVGVIEVASTDAGVSSIACDDDSADYTTYPATCNAGWCALSDHRILDVTELEIIDTGSSVIEAGSGVAAMPLRIREFKIELGGRLVSDSDVARGVESRVRVRADCLREGITAASYAACTAVPAP